MTKEEADIYISELVDRLNMAMYNLEQEFILKRTAIERQISDWSYNPPGTDE